MSVLGNLAVVNSLLLSIAAWTQGLNSDSYPLNIQHSGRNIVKKIRTFTNKKGGVFQDWIHFKNDSSKLSILHCTLRNISGSCGHWESRDPLSENPFGVRVSTLWRYLSPQLLFFHILFEQCTLCFGLCILDGY